MYVVLLLFTFAEPDSIVIVDNRYSSKQISAIVAYAGLSVEIKEGTSDIVKTPTFTSQDSFSVFEANAIGRYSESYHPYIKVVRYSSPRIPRRSILTLWWYAMGHWVEHPEFYNPASLSHKRGSLDCG